MVWQLLAIWAIVGCVMVWFVRDERAAQRARLDALARAYSVSPVWRHREASSH